MSAIKEKRELNLRIEQLPLALRSLASDIERGVLALGGVERALAALRKIELTAAAEGSGYRVTYKAAFREQQEPPESPENEEAEQEYKTVKKSMKQQFKAIQESLALGRMPKRAIVEAFTVECARMTSFPGRGEEDYPAFLDSLRQLRHCMALGDTPGAWRAVLELAEIKRTCHAKYK
jgi:XXXCH domain-containing protein